MNVALIGCGAWGSAYLRTINSMSAIKKVYVCELDRNIRERIALDYPTNEVLDDYFRILDDPTIEAVIIATPPNTHYEIAVNCLTHGKSVLVEKPITTKVEDAKKLIEIAELNQQILMTGHIMEYHPAVEKLKEYIKEGHLGEVQFINFERTNTNIYRVDVNVISDLTVHDLTILFYLLEEQPKWVMAQGIRWEDHLPVGTVLINMSFDNNILVHIHTNWHYPVKSRKFSLVGKKAMAVFDDTLEFGNKLKLIDEEGKVQYISILREQPLIRQCEHFTHCVRYKKQPRSDGWDALRVMKVMHALEKSLETKNVVYL